ncbi:hypothetical protein CcI49_07135 [Frankia sp. CcI49]|uniref:ABC transporter permease n=1 Tax=Frankia sp. CcI49 TaxID=1745382 RepID=UPI0009758B0E|nr:ABC transporter permease [Frankia sp. CcI49]ONH61347.1 hypothetical protein CcI49_07135 [Frankia sp. CcI49]
MIRFRAEARHQAALLARDPGPLLGYTVMAILLMIATRPLYRTLDGSGDEQAAAGMSVMFALFALKVAAAHLLNERIWRTWDRLRVSPAGFGEILLAKAAPLLAAIVMQQALLLAFAAVTFDLRPRAGWWALAVCALAWSACVLLLGLGAATLAHSASQLSAAGDIFALLTTVLGGAIVPVSMLPGALRSVAPASPGYWALSAYHAALGGSPQQLVRPLGMLALFGVVGAGIAVTIAAVHTGRAQPTRPSQMLRHDTDSHVFGADLPITGRRPDATEGAEHRTGDPPHRPDRIRS